jgi:DnaJ-class molecular chaperone
MMKNRRNYYRILQVQPDAPQEIIQASYRTLMLELKRHPDLGGSTDEAALLNEAYQALRDPDQRAAYDDELFRQHTMQTGIYARKSGAPIFCPVCKKELARKPAPGELCTTCRTPLHSAAEPDSAKVNSRTISRTKSSVKIEYYSVWPGKPQKGRMIDFSPKGMRFVCDEKIVSQTVLKISCDLFEASGIVTNASEEASREQRCYSVGVCFLAIRFADPRGTFLSTSA